MYFLSFSTSGSLSEDQYIKRSPGNAEKPQMGQQTPGIIYK